MTDVRPFLGLSLTDVRSEGTEVTHILENTMLDDNICRDIAAVLAVGCWVIEVPADGACPRMHGDRGLLALLEAPAGLSPEGLFDYWLERVDPVFRTSLMVFDHERASRSGKREAVVYAWLHPSKGWLFLRAVAARESTKDGGTRLMGALKEVETEFQIRMPDDRQFRIQEPRKLQIYAPYFLEMSEEIHEIDPQTLTVTPIAYRLDHYDVRPGRAPLHDMVKRYVHRSDAARVRAVCEQASLERLIGTGEEARVQFRVSDKVQGWRWVEAKIFAIEVCGKPNLLFKTVDIEERRRVLSLEAENRDLIEAMLNIYADVTEVDLTTGRVRVLVSHNGDERLRVNASIRHLAKRIASRIVLPSERDEYLAYVDVERLRAAAARRDDKACTFRMRGFAQGEGYVTVRLSCLYAKDRADKVYLVGTREKFDPTTNAVADKIASLACDCLYYVDLQSSYFRCLFAKDPVVAGHEGEGYWKNLCVLAERYVVPEDRKRVMRLLSAEVIGRELEESGEYAFTCGMIYDDRKYRRKEVIVRYADRRHGIAMIQRNDITDAYEAAQRQAVRLAMAEHDASLDELTQCLNRTAGIGRIERALLESQKSCALLLLDLDDFQRLNDAYGVAAGDEVLRRFARTLKRSVRVSDLVVRTGGDEFAVFLREVGNRENVRRCVQKIFVNIVTGSFIDEEDFEVGASMGIALSPDDGKTCAELLERAQAALDGVKRDGKNGFAFYRS